MLLAIGIMLIGLINFASLNDKSNFMRGQLWRLGIGLPLVILWAYLTLPAMVPTVGWSVITYSLIINCVITFVEAATGKQRRGVWAIVLLLIVILVNVGLRVAIPYAQAKKLQQVPDVTVSDEKIEAVDVEHIRLVPYENAAWEAKKVIGSLGNTFEVGRLYIQDIDNHLYWVAPLEFRGFFKWNQAKESPGYILVDAEDAEKQAEMRTGYQMKYVPSAYFGKDLRRHLYGKYSTDFLAEASFEIDDEFNPWYVMSLTRPTLGLLGEKLTKVVLVNPITGELKEYGLDEIPAWVDQVFPEKLSEAYNGWYGKYEHGFLNSVFAQKDVHVPTEWKGKPDVFGVIGADKRFYWFTGHTSPSASDDSLVGYMMMDAKTGKMTYYPHANGYYNEAAAVSTVSNKVSNFSGWHGAQPIFYNIYGVETWVVPVLAENNNLQSVGIVHAKTGYTVVRENKREALLAYKQYLASGEVDDYVPTQEQETIKLSGTVTRIQHISEEGNTIVYMQVEGSSIVFTARAALNAELALTEKGDFVTIEYLDTKENLVSIISFDNASIR